MPQYPATQLASYENLVWAWMKLQSYYRRSEVWYDELEIARFELRLDDELSTLARDLQSGAYKTAPIRPIPYPKRNADGEIEARQFFWISIRDQLAWLAYLNIVGPELDSQMPAWSYGNRLFRSLIVEQPNAEDVPRFFGGPYRNTKGQIYRPFKQSWPLYKRHVLLALKKLTRPGIKVTLDERETQLLRAEESLEPTERLVYLSDGFWRRRSKTVYWCSFDIEKFYPSIALKKVHQVLMARSETVQSLGSHLLESLTSYEIDLSEWTQSDLKKLGTTQDKILTTIPTGLIAAGFLANVAMLPIDDWASTQVRERQIAHFRYVDDHIVVTPRFDALYEWFSDYQREVEKELQCKINKDKTEPKHFRAFLERPNRKRKTAAMRETWLDPAFPSPLMTKTLEKVSDLAHANFDLLDREEQRRILNDLEHLLLARLPEEELPEKTRVTFAATLLGRFAAQAEQKNAELLSTLLEHRAAEGSLRTLQQQLRTVRRSSEQFKDLRKLLPSAQQQVRILEARVVSLRRADEGRRERHNRGTTAVLLKALELHPEKLRMWERVLEFCKRSGGSATTINDALRTLKRKHSLAYTYVSARILQVLARQSAASVNHYFNAELSLDQRIHAASFLSSVPLALKRMRINSRYRYVHYAHDLANLALSFANFAVRAKPRLADVPASVGIRLRSALAGQPTFTFRDVDQAAVWWVARNYSIWEYPEIKAKSMRRGVGSLPVQDGASWRMWRYLDSDIPNEAFRVIARTGDLAPGIEGWIAEVLSSKSKRSLSRMKRLPGVIGRVATALTQVSETQLLLPEWVKWTAAPERNVFDPKLSEWTALEITIQIAEIVRSYSPEIRREIVSSIFNFTVPHGWVVEQATSLTWEEWRTEIAGERIIGRKRLRLRDARIMPSAADFPALNIEFGTVRSLGILLLSLLRRDYRLPNYLSATGYHGLLSRAAIAYIQTRPCSSRTMAILESCVMDRSVETLWMLQRPDVRARRLQQDIATDVPVIQNIEEFIKELKTAQRVLSNYQLTVSAHQPRQLVPIYLEQYSKANWHFAGGKNDQEDDIE